MKRQTDKDTAIKIMKVRTNMVTVSENYGKKEKCPLCEQENDTTEHLLECEKGKQITGMQAKKEWIDSERTDELEKMARYVEEIMKIREKHC